MIGTSPDSQGLNFLRSRVLDESRSFFRVHTGYFSNIPEVYKSRVQVGDVLSPVLYRAPSVFNCLFN
ncbi:hypothetical protein TNCV_1910001 [Trichonephila clavipes]|nr:hypothetical protein TNCV_1910001 [Trichonephila clavipes]